MWYVTYFMATLFCYIVPLLHYATLYNSHFLLYHMKAKKQRYVIYSGRCCVIYYNDMNYMLYIVIIMQWCNIINHVICQTVDSSLVSLVISLSLQRHQFFFIYLSQMLLKSESYAPTVYNIIIYYKNIYNVAYILLFNFINKIYEI